MDDHNTEDFRLYHVSVNIDFSYAIIAYSEEDACEYAETALSDVEFHLDDCVSARAKLMAPNYTYPRLWTKDCIVYNSYEVSSGKDLTLEEAISWERNMLYEKNRIEEFKKRQLELFPNIK